MTGTQKVPQNDIAHFGGKSKQNETTTDPNMAKVCTTSVDNGCLPHSYWGKVFEYSLWHFILPDLKLLSRLPSRRRRAAKRAAASISSLKQFGWP